MSKQMQTRILYKHDTPDKWQESNFVPLDGELLVYADSTSVKLKIGDELNSAGSLPYVLLESPELTLTPISKPTLASTNLVYNGSEQTAEFTDFDSTTCIRTGTFRATNAGTYVAQFTPQEGYCWDNFSRDTIEVTWSISKATVNVTTDAEDGLTFWLVNQTKQLNVYTSVQLSGSPNVTSNETNTVSVNLVSQGSTTDPILILSGYNYCYTYDVKLLQTNTTGRGVVIDINDDNYQSTKKTIYVWYSKPTLEQLTWAEISDIAKSGLGSSLFSIGDCKSVTISGTIGMTSFSGTYYAYIIDFDHDYVSGDHTIEFGTFKTAATNGISIALIDSKYSSTSTTSSYKYFNMNHSSKTASTVCWKSCDMRYDILGSTNSSGALTAPTTTPTSPVSSTFMSALPAELRTVMKPISVSVVAAGKTSVEVCQDYLPLLSTKELGTASSHAATAEQNACSIYKYYNAGNSTVKYRHSTTGTTCNYWTRSRRSNSSTYYNRFLYASTSNSGSSNSTQTYSYGIAPIFRI